MYNNFEFFKKPLYPRDQPYSQYEYKNFGCKAILSQVDLKIVDSETSNIDIPTLNETYSLQITDSGIKIEAQNSFGASRAFATLIQLMDVLPSHEEDHKAYAIYQALVNDYPDFPWREVMIDGARHYIGIENIKRQMDAMAISKFNVMHLHLVDAESFPLKLDEAPQSDLFKGAYHSGFYYSNKDLEDLQNYAIARGIVFYPEIDMPGHAYSWREADPSIIAQCPSYVSNINNVPLNPANENTYTYIRGAIKELMEKGAFNQSTFAYIHRMMHLGGDEMVSGCWKEDPTIYKYMSAHGLTTAQLWQEFHKKVYDIFYDLFGDNLPY